MSIETDDLLVTTNFLFEIGTLRKIARSHRQGLLTNDLTDNIATHSYRVTWIALLLSEYLQASTAKVMIMALLHDLGETRSGDQNWVNKRYVSVDESQIMKDQLSNISDQKLLIGLAEEYEQRTSKEAKIVKDADALDQILLLVEYMHQGNEEARTWLHLDNFEQECQQYLILHFEYSKRLAKQIVQTKPSKWWDTIWTKERR